jgi:hypothetical protein
MSTTSTKTAPPRKMTLTQDHVRLRRRLENYLREIPYGSDAERRFVGAMIDLLYCINPYDRGYGAIVDSVIKLTQKDRLRDVFSRSTTERTPYATIVQVPSPSNYNY